ncbi:MAG: cell division protein SepF [Roseburia sp.]|nr:cell division protein SepF [Roseburia sp.]
MNEDFDTFLRRASNYNGGEPEYYEDTHDLSGNYIGSRGAQSGAPYVPQQPYHVPESDAANRTESALNSTPQFKFYTAPPPAEKKPKAAPLPKIDQYISPQMYQNIVFYSPRTSADVERLIDYLRRHEPAIIDLDPIAESPDAQRILDFTSGAVYALGGRIISIKRNLFLIVPEGIDVSKPESRA